MTGIHRVTFFYIHILVIVGKNIKNSQYYKKTSELKFPTSICKETKYPKQLLGL